MEHKYEIVARWRKRESDKWRAYTIIILCIKLSLEESPTPRRARSVQKLYEMINQLNFVCLYANDEVISFEDATKEKK